MERRLPAALAAVLVIACASPTLPLPPPGVPTQVMVDSQHVQLVSNCGSVEPAASVVVVNETRTDPTNQGVSGYVINATSCGSWQKTVFALVGDRITITQSSDTTDQSLPATVIVGTP
jgi:hypothetical protein